MKLGEALVHRAELQQRIAELSRRISVSVTIQEGDNPLEDPAALLAQVEELTDDLERTVAAVNATNAATTVPDYGLTVTALIARRDAMKARHRLLSVAVEAASSTGSRYSRSEIKMVRLVEVSALREQQDKVAKTMREIDIALQQSNWSTEVIGL